MLVLLVLMVIVMLLRLVFVALRHALRTSLHLLTCGVCDPPKDQDDVDTSTPLYSEACDPRQKDPTRRIQGITSYNILANPEIQAAFAIPASFAVDHKTLTDVALYRTNAANSGRSLGGSLRT